MRSGWDYETRKQSGCPCPADFRRWDDRAAGMTLAQLHHAVRDCFETARALNPLPVAGWYTDEAASYISELRRRGWRPVTR